MRKNVNIESNPYLEEFIKKYIKKNLEIRIKTSDDFIEISLFIEEALIDVEYITKDNIKDIINNE